MPSQSTAVALVTCLCAVGAAAQESRDAVPVSRTDTPLQIDGVLDDEAWQTAIAISDFTQTRPDQGAAPSEATEFRVLYDEDTLYVGVRCFDSTAPGGVLAREMRPDISPRGDDNVSIVLDANLDNRTGFFFRLGAAGGESEGLIEDNDLIGLEWDGLWDGKTSIDDEGWSAEFAIPLATIVFDPEQPTWGINVSRTIGRLDETIRWRNAQRGRDFSELSRAGRISGIEGLEAGGGLRFSPFLTVDTNLDSGDIDTDLGFDLFYRITPTIETSVTVNTDFAETEIDDRVVNLTRFPVFFPEQRDFFLEQSGIFEFGGIGRSPLPFFSRRIGIVDGEERGILAGLRVTGEHAGTRFGAINVQMDESDELGNKNLSALRIVRPILGESNAGLILTNGDPTQRGNNTLVGADFNYRRSADTADGLTWTGSAYVQATTTDTTGQDNDNSDTTALGGRFRAQAPLYRFDHGFARIGENYDPALGFVQRRGVWEFFGGGARTFVYDNEGGWLNETIRETELSVRHNTFLLDTGEPDTSEIEIEYDIDTRSDDRFSINIFYEHENLEEPFEIVDGVELPTGRYNTGGTTASFNTSNAREISIDGRTTARTFFNGSRFDYEVGAEWRPGPQFFAEGRFEFRDIKTDQGDFVVRIATGRASVQLSPEWNISSTIQYDSLSDEVGINARMRYEFRPGQELFVVLNEGLDVDEGEFQSLESQIIFKLGLTFQF
ncbi:MAG: DUF5916 domain-containing protein [Planctomycetota bacterium]